MTRFSRWRRYWWLASGVRALLVLIGLSPGFPLLLRDVAGLRYLGQLCEAWFRFQCHRDPERSLVWLGEQLPVCSRCFGIYAGLGLGALLLRPRLGLWPLRIWVLCAVLLMLADVASESAGLRPGFAWLRVASGVLLAYPVGSSLVWAARSIGQPG
jgi:uncharacterized membrane protein